jgi:uncharacterized protein (DUF885 family)
MKKRSKGQGMQQIAELERRITAALERIGRGVETLAAPKAAHEGGVHEGGAQDAGAPFAADHAEIARLTEALDEERMANAQLNERLRVLRDKDSESQAGMAARLAESGNQIDLYGAELTRLRRTVIQLNGELGKLREAAASGVAEPQLINRAMLAELEAMRGSRASEAAELADIVAALNPLIEEARADA